MKKENKYYDGTKLLSLMDINGKKPEIYICTTNRTGGKTTYFGRLCVNKFLTKGEKFCLVYRFNYELDDIAAKFFKDIGSLFFPDYQMNSISRSKGIYHELFLNETSCGYAVALNNADALKKVSHLLSDTQRMLFDEFQSETNHYCDGEVKKLISIHTSIARGQGEQSRYVPIYMISNPVSIINPYYVEMDISQRLNDKVKFLKGDGFVLEQGYVKSASESIKQSAFYRAFSKNAYTSYSAEAVYLNDNKSFIEKPTGNGRYLATLRYKGVDYGIREFANLGIVYCDNKPDVTFKNKITVTTEDFEMNYVMLKRNDMFLATLRYYFEKGCFRFKDLSCKEAVMKSLAYY